MKDGKVLSMTDQGIIRMENLVDWCPEAFEFLKSKDLSNLDSGRYELGRGIYAEVSDSKNQSDSERKYESHRRYVDIHWIIKGTGIIEMHEGIDFMPGNCAQIQGSSTRGLYGIHKKNSF